MLSEAAWSCWAKSGVNEQGLLDRHLPLAQHLQDAAAVAGSLWDSWIPPSVRRTIAASCGDDLDAARALAVFLAGAHDVGKASPAFASQVPGLTNTMQQYGLRIPPVSTDERARTRHELVSHIVLQDWLTEAHGWSIDAAERLAVVVGGHHGVQPTSARLEHARGRPDLVGGGTWHDVRIELLKAALNGSGAAGVIASRPRFSQPAQVLLTGIVIVADWIASSSYFDMLALGQSHEYLRPTQERLNRAWRALALPGAWSPTSEILDLTPDAALRSRFALGPEVTARPVQAAAIEAATTMDPHGLLIIEAPTGEGKTEAALLAAEVLAARTDAGGCFVALPTQATSDAMFTRVLAWLSRLPDAAAALDPAAVRHSVTLAHGKAALNRAYRDLAAASPQMTIGEPADGHGTIVPEAHLWFIGRKRTTLADFTVGTIDQELFTALKARHLTLRHLGMARKVLILDEIHAADVYMGTYLLRAIEWCGAYGVPVIALSATLPRAQRESLHAAYARGRASSQPVGARSPRRRRRDSRPATEGLPALTSTSEGADIIDSTYPALSYPREGAIVTAPIAASSRSVDIAIETMDDSLESLIALLRRSLADGGCALVVRNTVRRATDTFAALQEVFGDEVRLMHSRFIGHHRVANDQWLRERFGAPGKASEKRPRRSIVVGTQVVEQSLDIDFDLLITDLAPMDLLIQRMGRVHRHQRDGRPPLLRSARCVVVGTDWTTSPPKPVRGSTTIYGQHLLLRTAALTLDASRATGSINSPGDVARLVQTTYGGDPIGPEPWQAAMAAARIADETKAATSRDKAGHFLLTAPRQDAVAILGWVEGGVGESDDDANGKAQVRDSDESFEVILLRRMGDDEYALVADVPGDDGSPFFASALPNDDLAALITGSMVRIPGYHSHGGHAWDALLTELEAMYLEAWQRSPLLKGQLILALRPDQTQDIGSFHFVYDAQTGLEVSRND